MDIITSLGADAVMLIFQLIGVFFNFVFGMFLILAGWLVDVTTTFNFKILDANTNNILKVGWLAARDIANLGFVILAMGSALATVLRYPAEYDARRLLPKFVAAAILVNFSMTLAAIPIQFSNVLTQFFLNRVTVVNDAGPNLINLSGPLVNILGPQKLLVGDADPLPPDPSDSAGGAISAVVFASLATLIFNIIFTLLMAILLMAFAIMLISRYFILTFLIIFAPIACLAFVFPALKPQFSKWSSNYIKWVMIGPSMMFFVYMAIVVAENLPGKSVSGGGNLAMAGLSGLMEQFINLSFVTAILVMGLLAAGQTGTAAGTGALKAANALGTGAKKFIKERKDKFMEGGAQTATGQWLQKKLKSTSERLDIKEGDSTLKKIWKKSAAVTGFGQAVAVMGGNKKGLYGTLTGEAMVGAGLKDAKEKKPESKKDVEKKLGELQTTRANMAKKGLKTKDIDEEIKANERKLYRFRREELEADYAQQNIAKTNEAIQKIGYGEKNGKPKDENSIEDSSFSLNIDGLNEKQIANSQELQEKIKKLTKGIEDPEEKGKITETASKKKIDTELETIKNRISKLKKLKEDKEKEKKELSSEEQDALNMLQSIEYQLNTVIKKKEEEIQILGSLRKRRVGAKEQFKKAMEGSTEDESEEETEEEEYKSGTNEDGEEKTV